MLTKTEEVQSFSFQPMCTSSLQQIMWHFHQNLPIGEIPSFFCSRRNKLRSRVYMHMLKMTFLDCMGWEHALVLRNQAINVSFQVQEAVKIRYNLSLTENYEDVQKEYFDQQSSYVHPLSSCDVHWLSSSQTCRSLLQNIQRIYPKMAIPSLPILQILISQGNEQNSISACLSCTGDFSQITNMESYVQDYGAKMFHHSSNCHPLLWMFETEQAEVFLEFILNSTFENDRLWVLDFENSQLKGYTQKLSGKVIAVPHIASESSQDQCCLEYLVILKPQEKQFD